MQTAGDDGITIPEKYIFQGQIVIASLSAYYRLWDLISVFWIQFISNLFQTYLELYF